MELEEQVMIKESRQHQGKLQDRWIGSHTLVSKISREDVHLTITTEGKNVSMARLDEHLTDGSQRKPDVSNSTKVIPWIPETKELRPTRPWRRYTIRAMVARLGRAPECTHCAGEGGSYSEFGRQQTEKLLEKRRSSRSNEMHEH